MIGGGLLFATGVVVGRTTSQPDLPSAVPPPELAPAERDVAPAAGSAGPLALDLVPLHARVSPRELPEAQVDLRFAARVVRVRDPRGFVLRDYRAGVELRSVAAALVPGTVDRVLVTFLGDAGASRASRLIVAERAVEDEVGNGNPADGVDLRGGSVAELGAVATPELVSARAHHTLDQVIYAFDEAVERPVASRFSAVTADGRRVTGRAVTGGSGAEVTVAFDRPVVGSARFGVEHAAVHGEPRHPSVAGAVGASTSAPDLDSVEPGPGEVQLDFRFDAPVAMAAPERFVAYAEDGAPWHGTSVTRPAPEIVRVAFPDLADRGRTPVVGVARHGAVRAIAGEVPSTMGAAMPAPGPPPVRAGATSGPDLRRWARDEVTGQLTVSFDAPLDASAVRRERFTLVAVDGTRHDVERVIETDGDTVRLDADPAVAANAAGLTVASGAVRDRAGHPNPLDTVMRAADAGTEGVEAPS